MNAQAKWDFTHIPIKTRSGTVIELPATADQKKKRKKVPAKRKTDKQIIAELRAEIERLKSGGGDEPPVDQLVRRGIELTKKLKEVKEWYKERDEITEKLLNIANETGEFSFEQDGTILTLEDTFATDNKRWKSVCVSRFELEITKEG